MLSAGLWHRGKTQTFNLENPDAGKNFVYQTPATPDGVHWRLKSLIFQLQCDGTVINRFTRIQYKYGGKDGSIYAVVGNPQAVVAAQFITAQYAEALTAVLGVAGSTIQAPLPFDMRLPGGTAIESAVANLQAADQIAGVRGVMEEWIFNQPSQYVPDAGDGMGRADWVQLTGAIEKLNRVLETLQGATATP